MLTRFFSWTTGFSVYKDRVIRFSRGNTLIFNSCSYKTLRWSSQKMSLLLYVTEYQTWPKLFIKNKIIVLFFFFFVMKSGGYYLNKKLVHITSLAALGVQSRVSPRLVRSLIYAIVTKVGHELYTHTKGCWRVPRFASRSAHPFASRYTWCTCTSHSWCNRFLQSQIKGNRLVG